MKIVRYSETPSEERGGYSIKRLGTHRVVKNAENAGVYETTVPPRGKVKGHSHSALTEFFFMLTPAVLKTRKGEFALKKGDVVILDPGDEHEILAGNAEVKLVAVKVPDLKDDKTTVDS